VGRYRHDDPLRILRCLRGPPEETIGMTLSFKRNNGGAAGRSSPRQHVVLGCVSKIQRKHSSDIVGSTCNWEAKQSRRSQVLGVCFDRTALESLQNQMSTAVVIIKNIVGGFDLICRSERKTLLVLSVVATTESSF